MSCDATNPCTGLTPLALMQLLTDLPPLQHGDLTFFNINIYMHDVHSVYTVQYNRQFLKYRHFKHISIDAFKQI